MRGLTRPAQSVSRRDSGEVWADRTVLLKWSQNRTLNSKLGETSGFISRSQAPFPILRALSQVLRVQLGHPEPATRDRAGRWVSSDPSKATQPPAVQNGPLRSPGSLCSPSSLQHPSAWAGTIGRPGADWSRGPRHSSGSVGSSQRPFTTAASSQPSAHALEAGSTKLSLGSFFTQKQVLQRQTPCLMTCLQSPWSPHSALLSPDCSRSPWLILAHTGR